MSYKSIDTVQKELAENFFSRTNDAKKASGRALGTFIELITYYLLKHWNLQKALSIETKLPEYGNSKITHNVEFTLHKIISHTSNIPLTSKNITTNQIINNNGLSDKIQKGSSKKLIEDKNVTIIKNSTFLGSTENSFYLSYVNTINDTYQYSELSNNAYAMFECKRVGKEGNLKGPQTIEKAKQGAYVAKTVSSLQKVITPEGNIKGIYFDQLGNSHIDDYYFTIDKIVNGEIADIKNFILTIGIVSNHGNWFTEDNKNKELEVLSNAYDWLLFLSDEGLAKFIEDIFNIEVCRKAFQFSYSLNKENKKNNNIFTKATISYEADKALTTYFNNNINKILSWFNILNQPDKTLLDLLKQLKKLGDK